MNATTARLITSSSSSTYTAIRMMLPISTRWRPSGVNASACSTNATGDELFVVTFTNSAASSFTSFATSISFSDSVSVLAAETTVTFSPSCDSPDASFCHSPYVSSYGSSLA